MTPSSPGEYPKTGRAGTTKTVTLTKPSTSEGKRTDVVGVFPHPEALLRLAGAVLVEAHGEWQATDRRYLGEATMALLATPTEP